MVRVMLLALSVGLVGCASSGAASADARVGEQHGAEGHADDLPLIEIQYTEAGGIGGAIRENWVIRVDSELEASAAVEEVDAHGRTVYTVGKATAAELQAALEDAGFEAWRDEPLTVHDAFNVTIRVETQAGVRQVRRDYPLYLPVEVKQLRARLLRIVRDRAAALPNPARPPCGT